MSAVEQEGSELRPRIGDFLRDLSGQLVDPNHKRLMRAYGGKDPRAQMEAELAKMLTEVAESED